MKKIGIDMTPDEFMFENGKITECLQELFKLNQFNAYCCTISMLYLVVQQYMNRDDWGTKEDFFKLVNKTWDHLEEFQDEIREHKGNSEPSSNGKARARSLRIGRGHKSDV